jgi:pyridoxal phosphate enzyme (YggS family)
LQTNKVRQIIPFIALIHGVDSFKLLAEIDKQAAKAGRSVNCLLQIHIAREETKFGFSVDECRAMLAAGAWRSLRCINLCGVMAMASNTDDEAQVRQEFHSLYTFFREMQAAHFPDSPAFREISMGMSHDYPLAVAEGSTLVRIGSSIFGERSYQ